MDTCGDCFLSYGFQLFSRNVTARILQNYVRACVANFHFPYFLGFSCASEEFLASFRVLLGVTRT
jgi:hypothetical protein